MEIWNTSIEAARARDAGKGFITYFVEKKNSLIERAKDKFDAIDNGVNELMNVINGFQKVIKDIADSAGVIVVVSQDCLQA